MHQNGLLYQMTPQSTLKYNLREDLHQPYQSKHYNFINQSNVLYVQDMYSLSYRKKD